MVRDFREGRALRARGGAATGAGECDGGVTEEGRSGAGVLRGGLRVKWKVEKSRRPCGVRGGWPPTPFYEKALGVNNH